MSDPTQEVPDRRGDVMWRVLEPAHFDHRSAAVLYEPSFSRGSVLKLECGVPMPNVMATQPNIGGALCESPVIQFPVARRKVWLMPAAGVPCSNAANIGERKTWTRSEFCTWQNSIRPQKCIYGVPAQETAKHRANFGWPPVSDVAAVTKPRSETS